MNKTNESEALNTSKKSSSAKGRKLRLKSVKSIIGQYIKGRIRASDISCWKSAPAGRIERTKSRCIVSASPTKSQQSCRKSIVFQRCNEPRTGPKFYQKNIEICTPDILCLNLTSDESAKPSEQIAVSDMDTVCSRADDKTVLVTELNELRKISQENESRIAQLVNILNRLKLSVSLLSDEQQRLEHSREIRTIGLKLLNNLLKSRINLDDGKEGTVSSTANTTMNKRNGKYEQYEREKQIIEKILEQLARLEKVKMKLEYENIRNLYTIRELKKENAELEKIKADLLKELNSERT